MPRALLLPVFHELSDPALVAELAGQAEAAEAAEVVAAVGGTREGYDVAVGGPPGTDEAGCAAAGATWWMTSLPVGTTESDVRAVLAQASR